MPPYSAPLAEMRFTLDELVHLDEVARLPGFEQATPDLVAAVLEEAGKLASEVLAPLNESGDRERSRLENGVVRTPTGFKEAYAKYVEGGWNALSFEPDWGGQGLPLAVATAVGEMWTAANMGWALCPVLNLAAVELLQTHGTPEQQRTFLPKLVTGEWTGTMNLTEPQAGSDVGALRTRAVREGDHYRISGQKIFITYGDHDMAPNIIHMVLARTEGAPPGIKGISLFIVPKYLLREDGSPGEHNDLRPASLEHKLGIHASPTCVMAYGDGGGAVGYLVGEEHRGIEYMFTMMNNARLNVGLQGVAIAERAYQQARDYARTRVQGRPLGARADGPLPIVHHPDVRRMLLTMKAQTEASRALAYVAAGAIDRARRLPDEAERGRQQRFADLLIPVVKAWCTDIGVEVASTGVQIHGGMGYIEETGAAQHFRDSRIAPIYEGTNGIQANDLVGRKLLRDEGAAARDFIAVMRSVSPMLTKGDDFAVIGAALGSGLAALEEATAWLLAAGRADAARAAAGSVPYLRLFGTVAGGWLMARAALAAQSRLAARSGDPDFNEGKIATARFYAEQILPAAAAYLPAVKGGATVLAFEPERL